MVFWLLFAVWVPSFLFFLIHRAQENTGYNLTLMVIVAGLVAALPFLALLVSSSHSRLRAMADNFLGFLDRQPVVLLFFVIVSAIVILLWAFFTGSTHDYQNHYLVQWQTFMQGRNPYEVSWKYEALALGPAHVVFAPFALVHALIPKMFFVLVYFGVIVLIAQKVLDQAIDIQVPFLLFCVLVPYSPYLWSLTAHFGYLDGFVAALVVLAFYLRDARALGWAALSLGVAALFSFYVIFMLPFLCLGRDGFRVKPLLIGGAIIGVGYGAGYALWGNYIFLPFDLEQTAEWLSLYRALEGSIGEAIGLSIHGMTSLPTMIAVVGLVFVFCYLRQVPSALAAALGMLAALLFHRVGHVQFYAAYILLLGYNLGNWDNRSVRSVIVITLPYVIFLTGFMVWSDLSLRYGEVYYLSSDIQDVVGLISFPLGFATLLLSCILAGDGLRDPLFTLRWRASEEVSDEGAQTLY